MFEHTASTTVFTTRRPCAPVSSLPRPALPPHLVELHTLMEVAEVAELQAYTAWHCRPQNDEESDERLWALFEAARELTIEAKAAYIVESEYVFGFEERPL